MQQFDQLLRHDFSLPAGDDQRAGVFGECGPGGEEHLERVG